MKTEQILLALAIAREKSISKAAASLFISQPNASNLLNSLEKELGYSIFQRNRYGVTQTEKGTVFIEHAKKIESSLRAVSLVRDGVTEISFTVLSYHIDFPELAFEKLCEKYQSHQYAANLRYDYIHDTEYAAGMLAAGSADLAIGMCLTRMYDTYRQKYGENALETVPVSGYQMTLTCNADHPILRGGVIDYSLLEHYPALSMVQRAEVEPVVTFYLPKLISKARSNIIMDPGPVRYRLLKKTNGVLLSMPVPEKIRAEYGFDSLPIEDFDVTIFAIYRKDDEKLPLIEEYIGYCKEFC